MVATGISTMRAASAGDVGQEQILSEPLLRPAAVLENVPGLIVTQHRGRARREIHAMSVHSFTTCRSSISRDVGHRFHAMSVHGFTACRSSP